MSHHKPPVLQQNPFIIALTHHLSTLQISHQPGEMGRLKAPITLTISVFDFDPNNNNGRSTHVFSLILLRQDDNNSELQITEKVQIQSHWTIFIIASTC
jgi:hypothetical protein